MAPVPPTPTIMPTQDTLLPLSNAPLPTGILDPPLFPRHSPRPRIINPKYDLIEFQDSFSLQGELPGVQQEDIKIVVTDPHAITISGRSKRFHTPDTPPLGLVKGTVSSTEGGQVSIARETFTKDVHVTNEEPLATNIQSPQSEWKFWLSERSVGEFTRSFVFQVRVDPDRTQASLKNGLLSIVVPKA